MIIFRCKVVGSTTLVSSLYFSRGLVAIDGLHLSSSKQKQVFLIPKMISKRQVAQGLTMAMLGQAFGLVRNCCIGLPLLFIKRGRLPSDTMGLSYVNKSC